MLTIKDIARLAGVSTATVSKVLNDYHDVSQDTKDKVKKIMKEHNYRPNSTARSLSTNQSYTIGLFFTDHYNTGIQHPFFREVIFGLEKYLGQNGYDLLYFANKTWGDSFSYVEKCKDRHVDGVVLMGIKKDDINLNKLLQSHIPSVFVDLDMSGKNASYVMSDNIKGAETAVRYLYNLGHRKIGMVTGLPNTKATHDRLIGYQRMIKKLDLNYNTGWIFSGEYTEKSGYQAMEKILSVKNRPTAVFCHSDSLAIGAMRAIKDVGLKVPEDISLIGFDDIDLSRYVTPKLTTIAQNKKLLGQKAADLLMKIIDQGGNSPAPVLLPVKLKKRESCSKLNKERSSNRYE
ncbi:MAG: LacI family DNA-binding transcriptional regulator [Halothermotrichaceae bacterium]